MDGDEPGAERFFVFVGGMRKRNQGSVAGGGFMFCKMVDFVVEKAYGK
jgi:hypothetical protein